jgi:predicted methyltransferase
MKKLTNSLAILAASLVLTSPFVAYAQTDQQMDAKFNAQAYMKMANKDGMMKKADVMKVVSDKFDKMQKGGMISMDQMGEMLMDLYRGR